MTDSRKSDLEKGKQSSPEAFELEDVPFDKVASFRGSPTPTPSTAKEEADKVSSAPSGPPNGSIDEDGKIVVNWISPSDPENPKNWSRRKKIFNVAIISAMAILSPLCSAMFVCFPNTPLPFLP